MNIIMKHREDLISYIKSVILKYCPYVENRMSILCNAEAAQLDIEFNRIRKRI